MFEKIVIERADNGYIIHVDKGTIGGIPMHPKVFTSERALLKELRTLLKNEGSILKIGDFKGEAKK